MKGEEIIKCPNCGYENKKEALYCNLCGKVFKKEKSKKEEIIIEERRSPQEPTNNVFYRPKSSCYNHPERKAKSFCQNCKRDFCLECLKEKEGVLLCNDCIEKKSYALINKGSKATHMGFFSTLFCIVRHPLIFFGNLKESGYTFWDSFVFLFKTTVLFYFSMVGLLLFLISLIFTFAKPFVGLIFGGLSIGFGLICLVFVAIFLLILVGICGGILYILSRCIGIRVNLKQACMVYAFSEAGVIALETLFVVAFILLTLLFFILSGCNLNIVEPIGIPIAYIGQILIFAHLISSLIVGIATLGSVPYKKAAIAIGLWFLLIVICPIVLLQSIISYILKTSGIQSF